MKKSLIAGMIICAASSSLFAKGFESSDKVKEFSEIEFLKKQGVAVKKVYDADAMYILEILVGGKTDTIYMSKDKTYLIAGNVLNIKTGESLSSPVGNLNIAKNKEAFQFGKGDNEFIVFTDPECPYCKELERYLPQLEDKIKLNFFFLPLEMHKDAKELSLYIMSQDTTEKKIDAMMKTTATSENFIKREISPEARKKAESKLQEQMLIAEEFGVTGTPTIIGKNGNKMSWISFLELMGIKIK